MIDENDLFQPRHKGIQLAQHVPFVRLKDEVICIRNLYDMSRGVAHLKSICLSRRTGKIDFARAFVRYRTILLKASGAAASERFGRFTACAGLNRHVVGVKVPAGKEIAIPS